MMSEKYHLPDYLECPVCKGQAHYVSTRAGRLDQRSYYFFHCDGCRFTFLGNPRKDYGEIYTESYYQGNGADPIVDYCYEIEHLEITLRNYEWQGIMSMYREHFGNKPGRWLDYGCGIGGLVRIGMQNGFDIIGFDEGWAAEEGRKRAIPILNAQELEAYYGQFDFISAIEVLEHIPDPIEALRAIRKLLKPGGVLFLTTGNAKPWRGRWTDWAYTSCPDVHMSYFEPETLEYAFKKSGFSPCYMKFNPAWSSIIKFKILKTLGARHQHVAFNCLPWSWLTRYVNSRYQVTGHPYGIAV